MDVKTLLLSILTVSVVLGLVVTLINRGHPSRGMALGGAALWSMSVGSFVLAIWPILGTQTSVLLGYTAIAIGLGLSSEAIASYQGRRISRLIVWSPVPLLILVLIWLMDDIQLRTICNAIITVVQVLILVAINVSGWDKTPGWGARIIAVASCAYGVGVLLRGVAIYYDYSLVDTLLTKNWVHSITYMISLNGIILFATGLITISMEQTWRQLSSKEEELRSYVDNAHDVIYKLNMKGEFEYLSPNIENSLGFQPDQVVGKHFSSIVHPEDLKVCEAFFKRLVTTGKPEAGLEYRARHLNEDWRWHDTNAAPLFDSNGQLIGMLGIGRDIHERRLNLAHLEQLARHDPLTGLLNRSVIIDHCDLAIKQARRNKHGVAVIFLDLDEFKNINDRHGHDVGDAVLKTVATILEAALRKSDSLGRLGGDEYLIVLPDIDDINSALETCSRILTSLSQPFVIGSERLTISCSIGIALYPEHDVEAKELIRRADQAMYKSKRAGSGNISRA